MKNFIYYHVKNGVALINGYLKGKYKFVKYTEVYKYNEKYDSEINIYQSHYSRFKHLYDKNLLTLKYIHYDLKSGYDGRNDDSFIIKLCIIKTLNKLSLDKKVYINKRYG